MIYNLPIAACSVNDFSSLWKLKLTNRNAHSAVEQHYHSEVQINSGHVWAKDVRIAFQKLFFRWMKQVPDILRKYSSKLPSQTLYPLGSVVPGTKKVHVACQRPQPMLECKGLIIMWQGHEDIVLCSKAWHLVWEALCLIFRPWICHRANVILHVQPTFFSSFFQSISFVGKEVHSKIRVESLLQSLLKNS